MAQGYRFVSFQDADSPNILYVNVYNIQTLQVVSTTVTLITTNNGAVKVSSALADVANRIATVVSL